MENLDDLMRQKYNNDDPAGRFEFREEYWEQAVVLLEADEARKRKRRRWLLWWTFAGLLLGVGAGFWYTNSDNSQTAAIRSGDAQEQSRAGTSAATQVEGERHDSIRSETKLHTENKDSGTSSKIESSENNSHHEHTRVAGISASNTTTEPNGILPAANDQGGKKQLTANASKRTSKNTTHSSLKHVLPGSHGGEIQENETQVVAQTPEKDVQPKGNGEHNLPAGQVTALASGQTPVVDSGETSKDVTVIAEKVVSTENTGSTTTGVQAELSLLAPELPAQKLLDQLLENLFTLPLPLAPATQDSTQNAKTPFRAQQPLVNQIKPVQDKRFAFGVSVAAATYKPAPDQRWLGFNGAAFGTYRINKHWSALLGLGLRYQPGSWLDSSTTVITESLRYSFGYTGTYSEKRNVGLLSLEMPLAAVWNRGTIGLEVGAAPGKLLYALERFKQSTKSSLEPEKTTRNRLEKGDSSPFASTYVNTFAGMSWRFSRNTSLSLRGTYRFGAILKATAEDPAVYGGFGVELGLRVKLF